MPRHMRNVHACEVDGVEHKAACQRLRGPHTIPRPSHVAVAAVGLQDAAVQVHHLVAPASKCLRMTSPNRNRSFHKSRLDQTLPSPIKVLGLDEHIDVRHGPERRVVVDGPGVGGALDHAPGNALGKKGLADALHGAEVQEVNHRALNVVVPEIGHAGLVGQGPKVVVAEEIGQGRRGRSPLRVYGPPQELGREPEQLLCFSC